MDKINNTANKEEIVKAAQHVFARYGFRKTTMEEIASEAHRAKSSLYYYFKSKDEVFGRWRTRKFKNGRRRC